MTKSFSQCCIFWKKGTHSVFHSQFKIHQIIRKREPAHSADTKNILRCNCKHLRLQHPWWRSPLSSSWPLHCVLCVPAPPWIIYSIKKKNLSEVLQPHEVWIKELICNYKAYLGPSQGASEGLSVVSVFVVPSSGAQGSGVGRGFEEGGPHGNAGVLRL